MTFESIARKHMADEIHNLRGAFADEGDALLARFTARCIMACEEAVEQADEVRETILDSQQAFLCPTCNEPVQPDDMASVGGIERIGTDRGTESPSHLWKCPHCSAHNDDAGDEVQLCRGCDEVLTDKNVHKHTDCR